MVAILMHKRFLMAALLILAANAFGADLLYDELEKAYYESYAFERAQKYQDAMRVLYPVVKAYEKGYTINFRMGWLSYLNGNYADAARFYNRALSIYPASVEVLNCISLVHKARKDWAKVEQVNYQIIKIDYFNQTANYWYAMALKNRKKYDLAEKVCRRLLTAFPTSVLFLQELAENLYYKKEHKEALEIFLSVKILDPNNESANTFLPLLSKTR